MKVPIALLGSTPIVRDALKKLASRLSGDLKFSDNAIGRLVEIHPLIIKYPETKVLFYRDFELEDEEHFRPYLFWEVLSEQGYLNVDNGQFLEKTDSLFNELIKVPWGVLILLTNGAVVSNFKTVPSDGEHFFESFMKFFNHYEEVKQVFSRKTVYFPQDEYPFWRVPQNSLFRFMVSAGVPEHLVLNREREPFSKNEIFSWINRYILGTEM